jgi:hypothetical protein
VAIDKEGAAGMNGTRLKRFFTVLALCALSLSIIAQFPSRADGLQPLINEQWASGVLIGNRAGAFAYYTVHYPGDGSVVTIELRFVSADPVTSSGVGLNVYGPNAYTIGEAAPMQDTGGEGALQIKWSDYTAATWLVQVYNYIPDCQVTYRITATGFPAPTPTPVIVAKPKPKATPLLPLIGSGYLTGRSGGSSAYHNIPIVAGGPDVQLIMTYSPASPSAAKGIGFTVYGAQGEVIRGKTTSTSGERRATLSGKAPGAYKVEAQKDWNILTVQFYRVQVYNLIDGLTISFTLRSEVSQ